MNRKELIQRIEELGQLRLICYATSDRMGQETQIGDDAIPPFYSQLQSIGSVERLGLFIYSRGGHTLTGFAIANALWEAAKDVIVLVPFRAHSCATLIALSARKVMMTKFAQLTPIDPSITTPHGPTLQQGQDTKFIPVSVEDVAGYFSLAKKEANLGDPEMGQVFARLCDRVNPLALGAVYRAREQIGMLAKKLLRRHVNDEARIDKIVNALTRELLSHDYIIGRSEAQEIGIPAEEPTASLSESLWDLYLDMAEEMKLSQPWNLELELGSKQSGKSESLRGIIESNGLKHTFVTTHELKRTTVMKNGVKFDAVQGKIVDDGWRKA